MMKNQAPAKSPLELTWKILVIDDDEEDYFIVREMLSDAKGRTCETHWAATYAAGQGELISNHYDAVLVDYDLGARSGIELIREANERGYTSPLILFTGRGSYEVDVEAMQAGATMYLAKSEATPLLLERAIRYAVERKQTEEALRQSEEKFARAFQYNPAAMTITRAADLLYTDANESFCQMVGYTRAEIVGHASVELGFFSQAMREEVLRRFREEGSIHNQEFTVTRRDGALRYVLFSLDPIEVSGEPSLLTTMIDITERKQAESALYKSKAALQGSESALYESKAALYESKAALRASEGRMHEFLESTHDNFISLDREWRFTYANRHYGEVMGVDPQTLIGKNYWELFPQYLGLELEQHYRKAMIERVPVHFRSVGVYTTSLYDVSVYPTHEGIAVFSIDRTEELRNQQWHEDQRARLEAVLQAIPVGIWVTDQAGKILMKNEQADLIWAGDAPVVESTDQYQEYPSWDVKSGKKLEPEEYPLTIALRTGQPVEPVEHRILRLDGSEGTILVSVKLIHDREGRFAGAVAVNVDITERKRIEDALLDREAELLKSEQKHRELAETLEVERAKLAAAIDQLPVGICISDAQGNILSLNDAGLKLHDFKSEADMLSRVEKYFQEFEMRSLDGRPVPFDEWPSSRALRGDYVQDFQVILRGTQSGLERVVSYSAAPVRNSAGENILIVYLLQDLTERKQAEQALLESQERFNKAFEASPNAIVISRQADGLIENVNSGFERLFGYQREEALGRTSTELKMYARPADRQTAVNRLQEEGVLRNFELEIRTKTGEIRSASLSVTVITISGENFMVTVIEDITERKQAEAALKRSIERERARAAELETLMDTVPAMIWMSRDAQCQEMTGNRYGYEFLQMWQGANISKTASEEDLTLQPYRNFKDGREIPTEELPMQVAAATGQPAINYDFDLVFNDGTVRTVLGNVNPLFNETGQPSGAVAVFMDITDRRQVEEQLKHYAQELERSNQALQDFAFIASHDLQEPLRKIIMFGNSLRRQISDTTDRTAGDYLDRMQNAAERMQAMINGLLELSRINTRGGNFAPVNLTNVVEEVVSDLEARIQAAGGQVNIGTLPVIEADELQMRQLFQNLIGNAIKFHKPGLPPVVDITGTLTNNPKSPAVDIRVADNGIGFEQEYAERIFQPFQRLHGRNEYEGTGLGLAICQKIVERHSGKIEVHSSPGEGTTFIIHLPLKTAA